MASLCSQRKQRGMSSCIRPIIPEIGGEQSVWGIKISVPQYLPTRFSPEIGVEWRVGSGLPGKIFLEKHSFLPEISVKQKYEWKLGPS